MRRYSPGEDLRSKKRPGGKRLDTYRASPELVNY
jgi:hypothetical protein